MHTDSYQSGVDQGKLDMYRTIVDLFFDLQEWADKNIKHDDTQEFCDVCTLLDKMQLDLMLLGQEQVPKKNQ